MTPTGQVLTLVKPGPDHQAREAHLAIVRACLQDCWELLKEGTIEDVCVLGIGPTGVEILNTVPELGELGPARDELTDMIDETRRGDH